MFQRTKTSAAAAAMLGSLVAIASFPASAQNVQRIEITGSSIKRIDGETSAPVQVIRREDIEKTGVSSVEQLMRNVSAMVSSNSTAAASSSGATTGGISTISLRGLSAERTLILINGKRIAPYGAPNSSVAVDVDSIPIAAIDRVEILKDGASAVYGSDAIAGVVNFILRKDYNGFELSASYGAAAKDGKGDVAKASVLAGFGDLSKDRFNVLLQASIQQDGELFGRDRKFAASAIRLDRDNFGGSSRTEPGNISIPGFGVFNPRVDAATETGDCSPRGSYVPEFNPQICLFDTGPFVGLLPKTKRANIAASGRLVLSDAVELYGDLSWGTKEAQTVIQPSPIDAAFGIPFRLTTANPFYPTAFVQGITGGATPTLNVRYRPFIIGNRDLTDTATTTRLVLGAQGAVAGWDYDASLLRSASQVKEKLNGGYFRANTDSSGPGIVPLLAGQVNGSNGLPLWVNPFGDNNAEVAAAAKATNFLGEAFKTQTSLTSLQGKVSRELTKLDGGGLAIAVGGESRQEKFKLDSNPALATGNISGYGGNFVPIDVSRNTRGLFGELSAPVTKAFQLDAALRFDRYGGTTNPLNDSVARASLAGFISAPSEDVLPQSVIDRIAAESVGSAPSFSKSTYKFGARFQVAPEFLLRGTYSTGFRAPSLLDLYGPLQAGVSAVQNDPLRCQGVGAGDPNFCATQFNVYSGGNSKLKPEEATSLTLGFVAEPTRDFSIGADYFRTRVKNLIATQSSTFLLANEALYRDRVTRGPNNEIIAIDQRLENTGLVKIAGVDVDVRGKIMSPLGRVGLGWSATYMRTWDSQNPDGTFTPGIGTTSGAVSGYIPRMRHTASATLDSGNWAYAAQFNWQSGGVDVCGNFLQDDFGNCPPGSLPKFSAYETLDAQLAYKGIQNLTLLVGVRNLLDRDPPYVNGSGGAFQSGYDPTYVDPRGRFLYVQATYKF